VSTHQAKGVGKDQEESTARGASAFTGDATLTATLFQEEGEHFMRLNKMRYVPDFKQIRLVTHRHVTTVTTRHGKPQTKTLIFVVPEGISDEARAVVKEMRRDDRAMQVFNLRVDEGVRHIVSMIELSEGGLWMKVGKGGAPRPPEGAGGQTYTWEKFYDVGPVRRGDDKTELHRAVLERFEPIEGWGRLQLRKEGALW